MSVRKVSLAVSLLLGLALAASGQDSVSKLSALPGDAVDAYALTEQCNDYIIDLSEFHASWGTRFGIAPILKSSKSCDAAFYDHVISAQGMSNVRLEDVSFARSGYFLWNGPGFGVNDDPTLNDPGTLVDTSNMRGDQFGVMFSEFGGASNDIISAVINMDPLDPTRLYVTRVAAAQNANMCGCDLSSFGAGMIDANGNVFFRTDDFGVNGCGGLTVLPGDNYFGVSTLARDCNILNVISGDYPGGLYDSGATNWLVQSSATTYNTPSCVPQKIAGAPFIIGTNFNGEYLYGSTFPLNSDAGDPLNHLDPCFTDQRGNLAFSQFSFPGILGSSEWGTVGHLGRQSGIANGMNLFGVGVGGVVTGTKCLTLPAVVTDNCPRVDGGPLFKNTDVGPGQNEFDHYHSQVAFVGGNGQVAIGKDADGRLLAAGVVYYPDQGGATNPLNYIAVARLDPSTGVEEWTMAYYNNGTAAGTGNPADALSKEILDGPPTSPTTKVIGQTVPLFAVTGGTPLGPSVSAPMIDASGNVWFIAAVELFKVDANNVPFSDFDNALLRAVYDPVRFCFALELVAELGDVFQGQNSQTNYQIQFLSIADSNSVSSGTAWSGNILQNPLHNLAAGQDLCPRDPDSLAGLVISADITYDSNGDGIFDDAAGDESYNSLLYVGSVSKDPCEIGLSLKPDTVSAGDSMEFTTYFGNQGDQTMLVVTGVNGNPVFLPVTTGAFGSDCLWTLGAVMPPGFAGLTIDLATYAMNPCGHVGVTNTVTLTTQ